MNIGKALAVSAIAGMLMGTTMGCGGGNAAAPDPNAAAGATGGKASCSASGASGGKASCSAGGASGGKASCSAGGAAGATPSKY